MHVAPPLPLQGVILKPAFIYGEREVTIEGPDGTERRLTLPLQRVGRPLERILSTGIARTIAGEFVAPLLFYVALRCIVMALRCVKPLSFTLVSVLGGFSVNLPLAGRAWIPVGRVSAPSC